MKKWIEWFAKARSKAKSATFKLTFSNNVYIRSYMYIIICNSIYVSLYHCILIYYYTDPEIAIYNYYNSKWINVLQL